jgi:hypothetical protein
LINNTYIRGPMTSDPSAFFIWMPAIEDGGSLRTSSVYETGNIAQGFWKQRKGPMEVYTNKLFAPYSMLQEADPPRVAYDKVLQDAGANLQVSATTGAFRTIRDSVDQRIIDNVLNRTGSFFNGVDYDALSGFRAISWPELQNGIAAVDNDQDGMPDRWERRHFGHKDRGSPEDSSGDYDRDGYTDVEEYLNGTDPTQPEVCQ